MDEWHPQKGPPKLGKRKRANSDKRPKKEKEKKKEKKKGKGKDKKKSSGERYYKNLDPVPYRGKELPKPVKTFGNTNFAGNVYDDNVRYKDLNLREIENMLDLFDLNPLIQTCERIRLQDLVAGGIIFSRKGKALSQHASMHFSNRYCQFVKDLVNCWTRYGIAVCKILEDKTYLGCPIILEMRLLRIKMKVDYMGRREYKVFPTYDARFTDSMEMQDKELTDVSVLERRPPDVYCRCRSEFTSLIEDLQVFRMIQNIHLAAAKSAANPILVAQQVEQKLGEDSQTFGHPPPAATSVGEDPDKNFRVIKVGSDEARVREQARKYADYRNLGKPLIEDGDISYYPDIQSTVLKLRNNCVLNRQLPSVDLTGYHEWRLHIEERISSVLGVPRQMYAMSGYTHNVDPMETTGTFRTHQKELKQAVTRVLYQVYYEIYAEHHVEEALANFDFEKRTMDELDEEASVQIHMPGLVDSSLVEKLYLEGLLKYEAYIWYISTSESMPRSYFNPRPSISVKDLNGVKPEAAGEVKTSADGTTTTTTTKDTTKQSRTPDGGSSTTKTHEITKIGEKKKENKVPVGQQDSKKRSSGKGGGGGASKSKSKSKRQKRK
jgi:hypothetical protein